MNEWSWFGFAHNKRQNLAGFADSRDKKKNLFLSPKIVGTAKGVFGLVTLS
jgi:hypothetical protein